MKMFVQTIRILIIELIIMIQTLLLPLSQPLTSTPYVFNHSSTNSQPFNFNIVLSVSPTNTDSSPANITHITTNQTISDHICIQPTNSTFSLSPKPPNLITRSGRVMAGPGETSNFQKEKELPQQGEESFKAK